MGQESERPNGSLKPVRQSILRAYLEAIRLERGGTFPSLEAMQSIADLMELGVPILAEMQKRTPVVPEETPKELEFKGFRYTPNSLHLETDYHPEVIVLTAGEDAIITRLLRARGAVVPRNAFLNPRTAQRLDPSSFAVALKDLRIKLDDQVIEHEGQKTRRFIHTLRNAGIKLDPVQFKPSLP